MRSSLLAILALVTITGTWASRCQYTVYYPGLDGYGEKVALSSTGGALAAGAEGNTTGPTTGAYVSLWSGRGCIYNPPIELKPPAGLNVSGAEGAVEFGTQIKISSDGKTVLVVVDSMTLNISAGEQILDLGYIYTYKDEQTYDLVATLSLPVSPKVPQGFDQYQINDATGALSSDGKIAAVTFVAKASETNKTDPSADPVREQDEAGVVAVFTSGDTLTLYTIIEAPTAVVPNATFGRDIAMSGDGQIIAVSDDVTASIYIFEHDAASRSYPLVQTVTDAIPVVANATDSNGRGQMEHMMISETGTYLATVYGNYQAESDNSTDPLSDASGIKMYLRQNRNYSVACNLFPILNSTGQPVTGSDGGDMADLRDVQRVVAGFAGYGAYVFDFKHKDLAAGICPKWASVVLAPSVPTTLNAEDISEAVAISGNGNVVVQGWSTYNGSGEGKPVGAVLFTSLHAPIYYYDKTGPVWL